MNLVASGIFLVARSPFLKSTVRSAQNDCAQCFVQARAVVRSTVPQVLAYKPQPSTDLPNHIPFREMPAEEQEEQVSNTTAT